MHNEIGRSGIGRRITSPHGWRFRSLPGAASALLSAAVISGFFLLEASAGSSEPPPLISVEAAVGDDEPRPVVDPDHPRRVQPSTSSTAPLAIEVIRGFGSSNTTTTVAPRSETTPDTETPQADGSVPEATVATGSTSSVSAAADKPKPAAGLRRRQPVTAQQFETYVRNRRFDQVTPLAPGVVHGRYIQPDQKINVLLVHRSGGGRLAVSPGDRGPSPVGAWAAEVGAAAAVNGNWFGPFDGPAVSSGQAYGGADHGYTALFGFTAEGDLATTHHRRVHGSVDDRIVEGVAGHPTLILDRKVTTDFGGDPTFTDRHPRTAIGVTGSVDVMILVTVDGRRSDAVGMTGLETARLMERLQAHHAVMLDGGGSSAMWIGGSGVVNKPSDPGRPVGNQIAVFGGGR